MAGCQLKKGSYKGQGIEPDEFWRLFSYVFSDACSKTSTYKFGLIKSICDHVYDLEKEDDVYFYSYEKLFSRFTENYWNLVIKFKLRQSKPNGKSDYSKIESIIQEAYKNCKRSYSKLSNDDKERIVKQVTDNCIKYVVGALYGDFKGKLYAFDKKGKGLYLGKESYNFISKYKIQIEKLNYYAWAQFLEKIKDNKNTKNLLGKLDEATPKRRNLLKYQNLLSKEFHEDKCFYCEKELKGCKVHVDHFIPWSFVKTDNIWNFVLACSDCNGKKRNYLLNMSYVSKIEKRNNERKSMAKSINSKNSHINVDEEFSNYKEGIIKEMWENAKLSGFDEKAIKIDL